MNASWPSTRLGDVLKRVERFEVRDDFREYQFAGTYSFARGIFVGGRKLGSTFKLPKVQRVQTGDFVYCKIMAWEGAFGLVPEAADGCVLSGAFVAYEPDKSRIDPGFLEWYFKTPGRWQAVGRQSTGTNVRRQSLHPNQFEACSIPLPPLPEQQRIVKRIEELAEKVGECLVARQQATWGVRSLVSRTLVGMFKQGKANGWPERKLGDYVLDASYGTSEKTGDDETGVPILRMGNIQNGRVETRSLKYLHLSDHERDRLLLSPGDILVNRTNSAELVGKCAVFELPGDYAFASYLIRLRLDTSRAAPALVAAYINSPLGRSYMLAEKRQMTGQANVNARKLKGLPLHLPPLREQQRIFAFLEDMTSRTEGIGQRQQESSAEIEALLPGILDRAFKGEL